ncbi:MAG: hypothetical protein QOH21_495, partial [Acidobacteriota bacterium]|nr:hypothetical protein [Acidobacteriota bacterium]
MKTRSLLAVSLLLILSCTSQQAFAGRQRAVGRTPMAQQIVQWNHDWANGAVFY